MLTLTRKPGEKLLIGDDISVVVLAVHGNQVRIGIDAPKDIRVDREEVRERIEAESHLLQRLYVFDCSFDRTDGLSTHTEIAAESEAQARQWLDDTFSIMPGSLAIEIAWSPDLLQHEASGNLHPHDAATLHNLRGTLRSGHRPPCTLIGTTSTYSEVA